MTEPVQASLASTEETEKKTGQKKTEVITSVVLLVFSAMVIVEALSMQIMMQYGPGPGLFPLGIGVIIAVLSASMLIENVNSRKPDKKSNFSNKSGMVSSLKLYAGLIVYAALLNALGYLIMTFALVFYIMWFVEKSKIRTTLLTAFGVTLLLFLIFQVGLQVTLPKSPFGF